MWCPPIERSIPTRSRVAGTDARGSHSGSRCVARGVPYPLAGGGTALCRQGSRRRCTLRAAFRGRNARRKDEFRPGRDRNRSHSGFLAWSDQTGARLRHEEPEDLYEIIRQRYERGATILTSNRALEEWPVLFGDALLASAAMDRLLHHAHVIAIEGDSYRNPPLRRGGTKACNAEPARAHA